MNAQEPNLATREELPGQSATPESIFLSRLRAKDALAYEQLVREYTPRLLAIARRMMRNEEDAADAVQDALLSAYQALDSFESKSSVSTWLHRIVVNACLMKIRKNKRHASIEPLLPAFASDGHHASPIMPWRDDVL